VPGLVGDDPYQVQPAAEVGSPVAACRRRPGAQHRVQLPVTRLRRVSLILDFDPYPVVAGQDVEQERSALVTAGGMADRVGDQLSGDQLTVVKPRAAG
jgi:hypothetical protein